MSRSVGELLDETRALLASDRVTAPTRAALTARLEPPAASGVLSDRQARVLSAVAARLVPLRALQDTVDVARRLDHELASAPGQGWRYADLPPQADVVACGLGGLDAAAADGDFVALPAEAQDALLARARAGGIDMAGVPSACWFTEVLAALTRLAYAHPLVQVDMDYDGMADAHGFQGLHAARR